MVTVCALVYVPATGLKVGATTVAAWATTVNETTPSNATNVRKNPGANILKLMIDFPKRSRNFMKDDASMNEEVELM